MRIAHLSYSRIPSHKANAVQVMRTCESFASLGHEVVLYARQGTLHVPDVYAHYGVRRNFEIVWIHRPRLRIVGQALYGWRVAHALRARPLPQLLFARDIYSLLAAAPLSLPMIFEAHSLPTRLGGRLMAGWLFRRRNFARLVVVARALADDYRMLFPWLPAGKIQVVPNAVASQQHPAGDREAWPRPSDGRLRIAYTGQLYPGRGAGTILALAGRLPQLEFHIVGGTAHDLAHWRPRASGLPNVVFHGTVPPSQVPAFQRGADILIAPHETQVFSEGGRTDITRWTSPVKLFEYMAARRPIVASDLPAIRELLTHERSALLVPSADLEAWVQSITRLAADAALRERLAAQAFHDLEANFTLAGRACRLLEGALT